MSRTLACSLFFILFLFHFANGAQIKIEKDHKMIMAPAGSSYKWFYEGKMIEGAREQFLAVEKSGVYTLESIDQEGNEYQETVHLVVDGNAVRKIFLIGDSTVQNYRDSDYPMAGWGQVIQHFFDNSSFAVVNRAIGGRSSRGFIEEGRWASVKAELSEDDYLFIQWGHNDRDWTKEERWTPPADYKVYLKQYVDEARELGAIPVLISPMTLNAWRDGVLRNVFTESGSDYRGAMLEVANDLDVPFVDLNMESHSLVSSVGVDYASRYLFNTYPAGEYANYPNGLNDFTHFQEMGAIEMAKIIAGGIAALEEDSRIKPLAESLMPLYPVTVEVNKPEAGVITHSASYPAGATITLKALAADGHSFLNWKHQDGTLASTRNIYTFTMENEEKKFYALFDEETAIDCAGDFGGTAETDGCGICSGGSTERDPCIASFQMEEACTIDGEEKAAYEGFKGSGYVATTKAEGAAVEWVLNSSSDASFLLTFRYANGMDVPLNGQLMVNDADKGELQFLPTGAWFNWNTVEVTVQLEEGLNTFNLSALSGEGLAYLDLISLNSADIEAAECPEDPLALKPLSLFPGKIRVYPNPFSEKISLESQEPLNYKIYDLQGKLLASGSCSGNCTLSTPFKSGLYQLILETSKGSFSTKILKK